MPIDMPYCYNWELCDHFGSLAGTQHLDILLHFKVSLLGAKFLGPVLKIVLCICISALLVLWPVVSIFGSIIGGAGYGLLAPIVSTFAAVEGGKSNAFYHCIYDGTLSTVKGSFTVVRDFMDVCFHSYFSVMDDLRLQVLPDGKRYEIRLLHLPGAIVVGLIGIMFDVIVITFVAIYKSFYMLFKGWHRLFHDLIGREGPFLETICVPFAGLAILLWPVIVAGAVLASMVSSIFLGAYASVIAYQESSVLFGLSYIITSLAMYDEYSNDVLDMPECSCFPRLQYRKKNPPSRTSSRTASISRPNSFSVPPSRSVSFQNSYIDLKPLELLDGLFSESKHQGEILIDEGLIKLQDLENCKSNKADNKVINLGLPTYCILQMLLRSIKANSEGLLLRDNTTEITSRNRPKDIVFDWFINPLLIIKDQIKARNLSDAEENYLRQLVLLHGNPERLKNSDLESSSDTELKRAELDGLARRLRGITRSISRYPTFKRRFDDLVSSLTEELAKKNSGSHSQHGSQSVSRTKSKFMRIISQKSFRNRASNQNPGEEDTEPVVVKDIDIV
ncbi:hypothetical protein AQUCO_01100365v1 [Aquilegia coerulea]|uniref:Uncharacterized protein n=1 Tax=Aquilegia coerulea TaxID=218851 RepID=A0A2G5E6S8_AQUCA|nr:hypothetical protein AQUCO_01100365v1 [Aquilegia coerulea]